MSVAPRLLWLTIAILGAAGCGASPDGDTVPPGPAPEATSLLGRPLYAPVMPADAVLAADSALAVAPDDPDLILAAAAARASAWRFREAIDLYTRGMALVPDDARFYRFRGHRFITIRDFARAIVDLDRAAVLDSTNFDVVYHQGLAHYLSGHFGAAADAYGKCLGFATNDALRAREAAGDYRAGYRSCMGIATDDDARVAMTDWAWRALSRAGRTAEAEALLGSVREGMTVRTNHSYYENLLMYRALRTPEQVMEAAGADSVRRSTSGYAVGNWHLMRGDTARARSLFAEVAEGPHWSGFGVIAAEAELARLR